MTYTPKCIPAESNYDEDTDKDNSHWRYCFLFCTDIKFEDNPVVEAADSDDGSVFSSHLHIIMACLFRNMT